MKNLLFLLALTGCTDTEWSDVTSLGSPAHVTCYSGGALILDTMSTGKVRNAEHSDGYEFKDSETGKFIRVSANCIVVN